MKKTLEKPVLVDPAVEGRDPASLRSLQSHRAGDFSPGACYRRELEYFITGVIK